MTDNQPTFRVETEQGKKILLPEFQPSDLSDDQREVYDGLREAAPRDHAGAIAVNELAATQFEAGETVTLEAAVRRYVSGAREAVEALRSVRANLKETLAPVVSDLAEARQPLVEWRQDVAESMAENFDDD
jgi:hypothetical protein